MEMQLRDDENTSLLLFVTLYYRMCLSEGYDYRLPISLLQENMAVAERRNAILTEEFWWANPKKYGDYRKLSLATILTEDQIGIWPRLQKYIGTLDLGMSETTNLIGYISLLVERSLKSQ